MELVLKLKVNPLIEAVKGYITSLKNMDHLVLVLSLLHRHDFHDLINSLISSNKMFSDSGKVFHSENLNLLPTALMMRLLGSATFESGVQLTEEQVYEKSVCWAKYWAEQHKADAASSSDCDWKQVIQPLLPKIRFPIMRGEYFAAHIVDTKILSSDDCALIMQYVFTQRKNKHLKYGIKARVTCNTTATTPTPDGSH